MVILLLVLAIGASVGTFIENDFGSSKAKELVYNHLWYQFTLLFACINLSLVIYKTKMWKVKSRVLFHISFIVILIGAAITYIFGIDGTMTIKENNSSNIIVVKNQDIKIPFFIKLNDFELTRYPGSRAPSEFSSDVTVLDSKNNIEFKTLIFMNNTLTYEGYKFFQTSYPKDEKGTILSVNKDPGVEITYIGYALLFITLILNLFDKKSRFQFLLKKIKNMPIANILLPLLVLSSIQTPSFSSETQYILQYFTDHKNNSKELADTFGSIIVQDPVGRMKPLDTQNRDVLNKISGKDTWQGMSANQVILGMFSRPSIWKKVKIIRVKTPKLRQLLGVNTEQKHVSFIDFFDKLGNYKLSAEVEKANQKVPSARGTYERDLIKVDERLNIIFMSYRGVLLTIFPLPNDEKDKWVDFKTMFNTVENSKIKRSTSRLLDAAYNRNYEKGFQYIEDIKNYQKNTSAHLIPSEQKVKIERYYNHSDLFFKLSMLYLLLGIVFLFYGISSMFFNKLINKKIQLFISSSAFILFFIHTFGIAIRWYLGGYAPISNTYESMVYIAYSAIIVSVLFFRKSIMALSASFLMAGIFIFAAYLGEIDPQITNLVPVLKSYWLSIHVSVITASYGFFGVGAILGIVSLILFSLRSNTRLHLNTHIKNLTYLNEMTLLLGLILLVIGNFLGAIWANESWGRYWGWDPKETWAYISILIYTIVLHIRLIKEFYSPYIFNLLSIVAFSSILMTYFGVNFYLAGMHSYATGDPVPIPQWVYIAVCMVIALIAISYRKRKFTN
jgi:cytochrome c-type biogenesis protein CcsB